MTTTTKTIVIRTHFRGAVVVLATKPLTAAGILAAVDLMRAHQRYKSKKHGSAPDTWLEVGGVAVSTNTLWTLNFWHHKTDELKARFTGHSFPSRVNVAQAFLNTLAKRHHLTLAA